jgi:hypothetical protein
MLVDDLQERYIPIIRFTTGLQSKSTLNSIRLLSQSSRGS